MKSIFRNLNTILVAGVLVTLILILRRLDGPITVRTGRAGAGVVVLGGDEFEVTVTNPVQIDEENKPIPVKIDNTPLSVEIER